MSTYTYDRNSFEQWLANYEGKASNTAYQYALSIDKISRHYSEKAEEYIDIFDLRDLAEIKKIRDAYSQYGKYYFFGETGNATIRNAIAAYYRFAKFLNDRKSITSPYHQQKDTPEDQPKEPIKKGSTLLAPNGETHICEVRKKEDLLNQVILQLSSFAARYDILKLHEDSDNEPLHMPDLVLISEDRKKLLAVTLETGTATHQTFGEAAKTMGNLQKRFPDMTVNGAVISSKFDESFLSACSITDKITRVSYTTKILLNVA